MDDGTTGADWKELGPLLPVLTDPCCPLKSASFSVSAKHLMARRTHFEDYRVGDVVEFGGVLVDAGELQAFAERYDPQPIHLDAQAAAASPYGGVIASGWQTASLTMRMVLDHFVDATHSLGSPGIGRLSWLLPVRPGDVLRVRAHVRAARRSQSKSDRGLVTLEVETLNASGEVVMRAEDWIAILRLRNSDAS